MMSGRLLSLTNLMHMMGSTKLVIRILNLKKVIAV